jgi:hypothetical protein
MNPPIDPRDPWWRRARSTYLRVDAYLKTRHRVVIVLAVSAVVWGEFLMVTVLL